MEKAVKDGSINKMKISELKDYLKKHKQPQTGEKDDLVLRVSLHVRGAALEADGKPVFDLKPAELRKACAQRGLNPMGERDELLKLLIENLEGSAGGGGGGGGGGGKGGGGDDEGVRMAKKVLELDDDHCGILSLLGENITQASSVGVMKKQYLLISRLIHPDKLPGFGQATKAFQLLVNAYEGLTQPDVTKSDLSKAKSKTISRSNEGCYRTQVCCPRCMAPWGEAVDGLEPASYTHMMTGIKTYLCSTCLCEFGCMTAEHRCPFCRKGFDYSPDDFHRKITCGNKNCTKEFGFMQYNVSESRLKELREELKATQEKRLKRQEAILRRNARAVTNSSFGAAPSGEDARLKEEEKAFAQGLLNQCPRCGFEMGKRDGSDEAQEHLKSCKDSKKIQAYQKKKKLHKAMEEEKAAKRDHQESVTGLKTWEFLGASNENMWLLTLEQLRKQCMDYKIDDEGEKDALIARLVRHRNNLDSSRLLTDQAGAGSTKRQRASVPTHHTLPSNLESLSLEQLKSVAASHGIEASGTTRADVIACIERERFRDEPQLRLTMTAEHEEEEKIERKKRAGAGAGKRKKNALDDDDDDDDFEDSPKQKKKSGGGKKRKADDDDDDDDDEYSPEKKKGGKGAAITVDDSDEDAPLVKAKSGPKKSRKVAAADDDDSDEDAPLIKQPSRPGKRNTERKSYKETSGSDED